MANFRGRDSDALFSAAEVIQDSADRMESIHRLIMHEENLLRGESSDPKLIASIDYHKRDLVTMFGTTRWQLEDFEREADATSRLGSAHVSERALSRHEQFIKAMKEQLFLIENYFRDASVLDEVANLKPVMENEPDGDVLVSFLSGANAKFPHSEFIYEKNESVAHGTSDSTNLEQLEEIVEILPDDTNATLMNRGDHLDSRLHFVNEHELSGVEARSMNNFLSSFSSHKDNSRNLCRGYHDVNVGFNNFKAKNFRKLSDSLRYFCNVWLPTRSNFIRSYTKRRKDGELDNADLDPEQGNRSSVFDLTKNQQGLCCWGPLCTNYNERISLFTNALGAYCSRLGFSTSSRVFRFHNLRRFNCFLALLPLGLFTLLIFTFMRSRN